jgi:polysaccharide export outer membrane protein
MDKILMSRFTFCGLVAFGLFSSEATLAQIIDQRNLPSGSPVGTNQPSQGSDSSDGNTDQPAIVQSDPFEPIQINSEAGRGAAQTQNSRRADEPTLVDTSPRVKPPAAPGEFQRFVREATGRDIRRFGEGIIVPAARDFAVPASSTVPPDYALNVGDVVSIGLTGSIEGSADFEINSSGRIFIPRVGSVNLAGVRFRDVRGRVIEVIGRQYRGFDVTVSVNKLRGIRVFVTGFANNPGAYSINSLSTMVNAVMAAGGPNAGGSFRSVKLYRNGMQVADFDLYNLLRGGDRGGDLTLQNEDVLLIPPVGSQVAVVGSVNEEAIYEVKEQEALDQVLGLAGGENNLADNGRLILYRLSERETIGSRELPRDAAGKELAVAGDIIQVLSKGSLIQPLDRQAVVVRIEGEVNKPGNYFVKPGTALAQVLDMAGGLTPRAYVFGSSLSRESVRNQQRISYLEAVSQLETTLASAPLVGDRTIDAAERNAQISAAKALLDRLKRAEPDGRLVLPLAYGSTKLPADLVLENNDRLIVPPRVNTVGVFGAVYRPASFLLEDFGNQTVRDFVDRAGGLQRAADRNSIFIVRASGEVLTRRKGAWTAKVWPGDVIFLPVKTQSSSVLARIRDISTILFQFGLSAAAVAAIK